MKTFSDITPPLQTWLSRFEATAAQANRLATQAVAAAAACAVAAPQYAAVDGDW